MIIHIKHLIDKLLTRQTRRLYWKESNDWERKHTISERDAGAILVPKSSSSSHRLELEFQPFNYGVSSISIPMEVPQSAIVSFHVNGCLLTQTFNFPDRVCFDIATTGSNSSVMKGELTVSTTKKSKRIAILDGNAVDAHVSLQERYVLKRLLDLLLFIGLLFTPVAIVTAIGTVGGVRALGVRPEFAGLTVPIWALLGVPKWPVPVLPFIVRRFHGKRKCYWRILGIGLTIIGAVWAIPIMRSLIVQYHFNNLVDLALDSYENPTDYETLTDVQAAPFLYAPWRVEGKILLERYIYNARIDGSDLSRYWQTVRELLQESSIKKRIESLLENDERPRKQNEYQGDPIVWFASLLPEAESHDDTVFAKAAMELLRSRPENLEAKLYLYWLLYECEAVLETDPKQHEKTRESLKKLVDLAANDPYSVQTMAYQMACDTLGLNEILDGRIEKGLNYWDRILAARSNALNGKSVPWLRPREKLACYHAFMLDNHIGREIPERLKSALQQRGVYDTYLLKFKAKFPKDSHYRDWYSQDHWQLGTWSDKNIIGESFSAYVRGLKDKGWD